MSSSGSAEAHYRARPGSSSCRRARTSSNGRRGGSLFDELSAASFPGETCRPHANWRSLLTDNLALARFAIIRSWVRIRSNLDRSAVGVTMYQVGLFFTRGIRNLVGE